MNSTQTWEPVLQKYKLVKKIGTGVFGTVFLAKHLVKQQHFAIKLVEVNAKN